MAWSKVVVALVFPISVFTCNQRDRDCEFAIARMDRIEEARGVPKRPAKLDRWMLEKCKHGKYATSDPVVHCALDADSDQAAAACIDRFTHDVLHMSKPNSAGSASGPVGINPLLDPSFKDDGDEHDENNPSERHWR